MTMIVKRFFVNHKKEGDTMSKSNTEIRTLAKQSNVFLYEIAERLNVSEPTITRRLRRELPDEEKAKIKGIIAELAAEKASEKTA